SVDSYYQEIGRAGRDGSPATTVLFYSAKDLTIHKFFKGGGQIRTADVQSVLDALDQAREATAAELQETTGLSKTKLARALNRLEEAGAVVIGTDGVVHVTENAGDSDNLAEEASEAQAQMHDAELDRLDKMRLYAEHMECRRAYLITYFGEAYEDGCNNCDNCQGRGTARAALIAEARMECAAETQTAPQASNAA
ncbi:MAG: ATP-dependent helicase RecQ, partial [Bryobacterales bacterium]|nr:ATP-dependent helicase RecQ [Bryobacterales bacterium]